MRNITIIIVAFALLGMTNGNYQQATHILEKMHSHLEGIDAHSYRLELLERRMGGEMHRGEMKIFAQEQPIKIQLEMLKPTEGAMIEYDANEKGIAVVTPRKWLPAIKFRQDIHSKLLRPGHYAIDETRLTYIDEIIRKTEGVFRQRGIYTQGLAYQGTNLINGKTSHCIAFEDDAYHIQTYTAKAEEKLLDLAKQKLIPPYKIRELNPFLKDYNDLPAGKALQLPSSYAKRTVLYVSAKSYLPNRLEVYDEKGLFERFDFYEVKIE